ncbi:GINS complex subunit 1 [Dictyostelium discoideum AX4]|uniref:Probable DNA replication complex GINS protein PSF1 n=1 Tax=Dictyostelium discoideum TaxID=44689 RepID=PSF1_DICDI|nr:GINS complex subunit 1 [Dictyostelium discoideum AX4]Q54HR6.1 RecName: Full=Probable DNA replication complex GINS protein PSF1; AltName: Full=GINS complex subunit 1 [Dictyostelium discoideum]EAL62807.1 GINS complex subunit 1 [Dictyostelium discoideum AX4]|eukprot:XP_636320.1 GINS complex subunit 1 [Dictyostelium discoideum AX4]
MFTKTAIELIKELRGTDSIPHYNDTSIKATIDEMIALYEDLIKTITEHKEQKKEPFYLQHAITFHNSINRDKRCILAYLNERLNRIKEYRWSSGQSLLPDQLKERLSQNEIQFFSEYDKILTEYNSKVGLDLTIDPQPPKELYIEVRVIKELGEVVLNSGCTVNLNLNTTHFLKRSDITNLVKNGSLEHII